MDCIETEFFKKTWHNIVQKIILYLVDDCR